MALYRNTCIELSKESYTKELYRFQGAKTCSRLEIGKPNAKKYIYVSASLDHHMYFTMKRLKQLIDQLLQETNGTRLNGKALQETESYNLVKKLVLYQEGLDGLTSYRLITPKSFDRLVRGHCVRSDQKVAGKHYVEKVDRRVCGGGFGFGEEWKDLLNYVTLFSATAKISRKDILEIISNMRKSGKMNQKDNLRFLLGDPNRYRYEMNPNIISDFNKYDIINVLEIILEKGLIPAGSPLEESPKQVIKEVVEDYEVGRQKTLELLRKKYK